MKPARVLSLLLALLSLLIGGCGGGTRGTGDLQLSGDAVSTAGVAFRGATVTFLGTGDSAVTDDTGRFVIVTGEFTGPVEFLINTGEFEVVSRGGELTADAAEVEVNIRIDITDTPAATQRIEVKRRRDRSGGEGEDDGGRGRSDDDRDGDDDSGRGGNGRGDDSDDDEDDDPDDDGKGRGRDDDRGDSRGGSDDDDIGGGSNGNGGDDSSNGGNRPENERFDFRGPISAISSDRITAGGKEILVDSSTQFDGKRSLSEFSVGEEIELRAENRSGVWVATRIKSRR